MSYLVSRYQVYLQLVLETWLLSETQLVLELLPLHGFFCCIIYIEYIMLFMHRTFATFFAYTHSSTVVMLYRRSVVLEVICQHCITVLCTLRSSVVVAMGQF